MNITLKQLSQSLILLVIICFITICTNSISYSKDVTSISKDVTTTNSANTTEAITENESLLKKNQKKVDITKDVTTIKETAIQVKQKMNDAINQQTKPTEDTSLDDEKTIKVTQIPILIDKEGNEVIYIAGLNKLETVQRSLKIRDRIVVNLYKVKQKGEKLSIEYSKDGDDLVFYINQNEIFRLNELDLQVNNLQKPELLNDIKECLNHYSEMLEDEKNIQLVEKQLTDWNDIIYFSIFTIILFIIIEFIRKKLNKIINNITHKHFTKFVKPLNKEEKEKQDPIETEKKEFLIELIVKQLNFIVNFIIISIELITIFIFICYLFYFNLQTHHFARLIIHSIESYSIILKNDLSTLLKSEAFWGSFGYISAIIIFLALFIILTKHLSQLANNIIIISSESEHSKYKRLQTLNKMTTTILYITLIFLAIVSILMHLGVEVTPVLAGAGIAGLAISFGAQNLIKDIINGIFIIFENQFGIGDTVKINGEAGQVEDMSLRITILRNFMTGKVCIIPNGSIQTVEVYTKEWAKANITISIAYKEDIDTAITIIKETAEQMRKDYPTKILKKPRVLGVENLNDSSIDIKLLIETLGGKQWEIEREFRRRIKYALDNKGIEIPFPHRTVYLRNDDIEKPENNNE